MKKSKYIFIVAILAIIHHSVEVMAQNPSSQSQNVSSQMQHAYSGAVVQRDQLALRISLIETSLKTANKKEAKKLNTEMAQAQKEYDAVLRLINTMPRSVTDPDIEAKKATLDREKLASEMDREVNARKAQYDRTNPTPAAVSDVKQTSDVKQMSYEEYQRRLNESSKSQSKSTTTRRVEKSYGSEEPTTQKVTPYSGYNSHRFETILIWPGKPWLIPFNR